MYRALSLAIGLCIVGTNAVSAPGPLRKWKVADWEISEYRQHCSGSSVSLRAGTIILFFAICDLGLHAVAANSTWRMTPNRNAKTTVSIDGQTHGRFPTSTYSETGLAVTLPASLLQPLQEGDTVTFQYPRSTYSFPLKNTRIGLAALVKCYLDQTRASETAATPQPKQSRAASASSGTGLFISREGHVLTNAHVVNECSSPRITDKSGSRAHAAVIARDEANDLALLKTGLEPPDIATFKREPVRLGESVAAFGFPLSSVLASSGNFTLGSVSAIAGLRDDTRFMQISAPVQPGNSGGPLLDKWGNVAGIVSSKLDALAVMVATGGDIPQNVNFAIKWAVARNFLESNRIDAIEGSVDKALEPTDLAERAQTVSVLIHCNAPRP